jgi:hypothetical protein
VRDAVHGNCFGEATLCMLCMPGARNRSEGNTLLTTKTTFVDTNELEHMWVLKLAPHERFSCEVLKRVVQSHARPVFPKLPCEAATEDRKAS